MPSQAIRTSEALSGISAGTAGSVFLVNLAVIFLREKAPKALENFIQQISISYIESRLCMAEAAAKPENSFDWDDPLQDEVLRTLGGLSADVAALAARVGELEAKVSLTKEKQT